MIYEERIKEKKFIKKKKEKSYILTNFIIIISKRKYNSFGCLLKNRIIPNRILFTIIIINYIQEP